jgi:hypothetical protein
MTGFRHNAAVDQERNCDIRVLAYLPSARNFSWCRKEDSNPDPRIVAGTKVATVNPSCQNTSGTYVSEIAGGPY